MPLIGNSRAFGFMHPHAHLQALRKEVGALHLHRDHRQFRRLEIQGRGAARKQPATAAAPAPASARRVRSRDAHACDSMSGVTSTTPFSVTRNRFASSPRSKPMRVPLAISQPSSMMALRIWQFWPMRTSGRITERSTTRTLLDAHAGEQQRLAHRGARDDGAARHQRVDGDAAPAVFVEHELRRRRLRLVGPDRPVLVVDVELGIDPDQLEIGLVKGIDCSNIAPIRLRTRLNVPKRIGKDLQLLDGVRNDVLAEIVLGLLVRGIFDAAASRAARG